MGAPGRTQYMTRGWVPCVCLDHSASTGFSVRLGRAPRSWVASSGDIHGRDWRGSVAWRIRGEMESVGSLWVLVFW